MRKYYYLEIKQFTHYGGAYEFQIADMGLKPRIFRYLNTAIGAANWQIEFQVNALHYEIVTPNEQHPDCKGACKFACTLRNNDTDIREEIRIYAIDIITV